MIVWEGISDEIISGVSENSRTPIMREPSDYLEHSTDVLVIGGGAAATEAAIRAADSGVDVILVDKKKYGRSGDSGQHPAGWHSASYLGAEGDNAEMNLRDAVESGKWMINQKLAEALCEDINRDKLFHKLEDYGCLESRTNEGNLALSYSVNKPRATAGYRLFTHAYEVFKRDAKVLEHTMVTCLLTDGDAVVGAAGINIHTGAFIIIKAKSTVLATGGVGLAIDGSLLNERTGDGHAIAYKVGAEFWNMEFRAMPLGCVYPENLSRVPYLTIDPSTVRDSDGEEFLKDMPEAADYASSGLYRGVREGEVRIAQGKASPRGGFYGKALPTVLMPIVRLLACQGMDLDNFEYYWTTVYDFGGLVINEKAETNVPGLYACGEMASNMGAGYLPIRMFTHCIGTGGWAGKNAALRAKSTTLPSVNHSQVNQEYQRVHGILDSVPQNPVNVSKARQRIQQAARKGCGPWRNHDRAIGALNELEEIGRTVLPKMYVRDKSKICNVEWKEALEASNMAICAEMVTRAALARTETRGPHIREDHPYTDNDNWLKNVFIKKINGKMATETRPVVVTKVPPPSGRTSLEGEQDD